MTDTHDEDMRLDRSITDAFCAECPSTACDLPGDQAKCATLLLIGSIWARGTDLYYALVKEHEAVKHFTDNYDDFAGHPELRSVVAALALLVKEADDDRA